ncbi:NAD(P)H-dependent oxidoreductase [Eubacteriaceae bacterium ES2]|nr:NAD(P)H-dependent oxidoreductase [Eubacteriaceae bacterium ES2]
MDNQQKNRESIIKIFADRYTCKGYDETKKVSDEDFNVIMEVARLSPSSMGLEPWKFLLLNNERIKERLKPVAWGAQASLAGASHFVIILARKPKDLAYDSAYVEYIMKDIQHFEDQLRWERKNKLHDFQENDLKITADDRLFFEWAVRQTYIPLANMLTAAAMLGVDSTPMEGFNYAVVEEILAEEKVYDQEHFGLAAMIAFGYKNREHRPKTRRPMAEVFQVIS